MGLLSTEDQLKYCIMAKDMVAEFNITLSDACRSVCEEYCLPITPKTLRNLTAIHKNAIQEHYNQPNSDSNDYVVDDLNDLDDNKENDLSDVFKEIMRENERLRKNIKSNQSKNQFIKEIIEDAVKSLPSIRIPRPNTYKINNNIKNRTEIAMLDLSDIHLGAKMDSRDINGLGEYDVNTFTDQCMCIVHSIGEILEIQRSGGLQINKLIVNCLGDLVDGENIYPGHMGELSQKLYGQLFGLGEELLQNALIPIFRMFNEVHIMSVDGNHGRVGTPRDGFDRKLNFDAFLMVLLCQRLQNDQDWVHFHMSQSPFMIYELFGKYHCLSHGNTSGSPRSPLNGIERYISNVSMLNRNVIDFLHIGHFHRDMNFNVNFSEILVNGSWLGPRPYSVGKMTVGDYPQQLFYGVNRKHLTWRYPIYLDKHIHHVNVSNRNSDLPNVLTPVAKVYEPIRIREEKMDEKLLKSFG